MAYKIKKSILSGTSGHRKALKLAKANLRLNRSVNKNMPDGRSKSSAFQLTDEEKTAMIEENITEVSGSQIATNPADKSMPCVLTILYNVTPLIVANNKKKA